MRRGTRGGFHHLLVLLSVLVVVIGPWVIDAQNTVPYQMGDPTTDDAWVRSDFGQWPFPSADTPMPILKKYEQRHALIIPPRNSLCSVTTLRVMTHKDYGSGSGSSSGDAGGGGGGGATEEKKEGFFLEVQGEAHRAAPVEEEAEPAGPAIQLPPPSVLPRLPPDMVNFLELDQQLGHMHTHTHTDMDLDMDTHMHMHALQQRTRSGSGSRTATSALHRFRDTMFSRQRAAVHAPEESGGGSGGGGEGGGGQSEEVLKVVGYYALPSFVSAAPEYSRAWLKRVDALPFRRISEHFFSCVDPRAEYAMLGTPGGDIVEFINAMRAMEMLQNRLYNLNEINALFQDAVRLFLSHGRKFFYMHTDEKALKALSAAAGVADARQPNNEKARNRVVQLSAVPAHVGCQHLRAMLEKPDDYGVRKQLVENIIQVYMNVYLDDGNPQSAHLLYVVLRGEPKKGVARALIYAPDQCPGIAPLIAPTVEKKSVIVHHDAHAAYFRQDLARFFVFKNSAVEVKDMYRKIQEIAQLQSKKLEAYTSGPSFDAIFANPEARWPFPPI